MKKYGMLFSFTLILSLLIIHAGNVYKGTYVPVSVVKVSPITAESSVYSNNGTVERVDSRSPGRWCRKSMLKWGIPSRPVRF